MKLEDQVCTLEQGKRLQELGLNVAALFSWFGNESHIVELNKPWIFIRSTDPINQQDLDHRVDIETTKPLAPAYSAAELGEMLPDGIVPGEEYGRRSQIMTVRVGPNSLNAKNRSKYKCSYQDYKNGGGVVEFYGSTEAQVRAKTLIHMLEKEIVKAGDISEQIINNQLYVRS